MIELNEVSKTVKMGGQPLSILKPLSLTIERGQCVAVMGPSGSGKSTLLGLLAGLDAPSNGSIAINGKLLTGMNEDQLAAFRGKTIGFVFQSFQLIPTLTARENVQVPMEIQNLPKVRERSAELMEQVGLSNRLGHYPAQLSGGEQQRVAIARAFVCNPPVLLADEPTGNLDSATGTRIIELLKDLHKSEGSTLVLVTHDPEVAAVADRIVHLRDGALVTDTMGEAPGASRGVTGAVA